MGPVGEVRSALVVSCGATTEDERGHIRALYRLLGDPEVGGFQLSMLVDPSPAALRQELSRFLADRAPQDLVVVHLAGRVLLDADGAAHLCTGDTGDEDGVAIDGCLPMAELESAVAACRSERIVLLFDHPRVEAATPNGAAHRTVGAVGERFRRPGRAVFHLATAGVVEALERGPGADTWAARRTLVDTLLLPDSPARHRAARAAATATTWTLVGVALLVAAMGAMVLHPPTALAVAAVGTAVAVLNLARLAAHQRHDPAWHELPSGEGIPFYQLYMLRRSQKSKDFFRHH